MIRQILKIIWNERRSNILMLFEFVIIFCILWFCCDYLYFTGALAQEPLGYDIENTYKLIINQRDNSDSSDDEKREMLLEIKNRIKNHPAIQNVSFSRSAMPYGGSTWQSNIIVDTVNVYTIMKWVDPEFFDVFNLKPMEGRLFNVADITNNNCVIICPERNDIFGIEPLSSVEYIPFKYTDVKIIKRSRDDQKPKEVIGVIPKLKSSTFNEYQSTLFYPLTGDMIDVNRIEIVFRTKTSGNERFTGQLKDDFKTLVNIGPFYLSSVLPVTELKKELDDQHVGNELRSILSVTLFLIINIFLVIIGTFWSRTESRKSEIGLRLAMGSSKRKIKWQLFTENMIILLLAAIIGTYISLNLNDANILQAINIPLADRKMAGLGAGQDWVNSGITFLFLTVVSGLAIWYPARLASRVQPAEALRSE